MRIGVATDVPRLADELRDLLAATPHAIDWQVASGPAAVTACARDVPDLVIVDLRALRRSGVEATRRMMAETPCAILLVTESAEGSIGDVYDALGHGALDAIDVPLHDDPARGDGMARLVAKIGTVARLVAERPRPREVPHAGVPGSGGRLVAIGASTGGPTAVGTLLAALPPDFRLPVILVQHIDARFVPGLAAWLRQHSALDIRAAVAGDRPEPGTMLIAASADHLVFTGPTELGYVAEPVNQIYRPSVDVFFESAALRWPGAIAGVLLTGMGRDGAVGLKALRDRGHRTFAQDQGTSAVYGMPKAAAALGAAEESLPLAEIAARLVHFARSRD